MKSIFAKVGAAFVIGSMALASVVPVQAQSSMISGGNRFDQRDSYVQRTCNENGFRSRDCRDWRDNRSRWDDRRYQGWYRDNHRGNSGNAVAAGIFGLAIGAIVGGAINNSNGGGSNLSSSHVRRCEARFQSYDRGTDSYMGFDGYRHRCNL